MNRFDEKYIFRKACRQDLNAIAEFFDKEWKKDGVLSNEFFLEYEFAGTDDTLNIILALNKGSKTIQGLWGYYPFSNKVGYIDVAGGPWKVKQDKSVMPFLGNEIMVRAKKIIDYRAMLGIGDNPNTSGMYHKHFRKDYVGRLNQYYLLNRDVESFFIAVINHKNTAKEMTKYEEEVTVKEIENFEEISEEFWNVIDEKDIPYKDKNYVRKRFFEHPIYKYNIIGIYWKNELMNLVVMRIIKMDEHSVNRIVDCIGRKEFFKYITVYLEGFMKDNHCEYTDFYNYGFSKDYIKEMGFIERKEDDINIIQNYFEPFVQKNIEIYFSTPISDVFLCKADGDQDRPNYLSGDIG